MTSKEPLQLLDGDSNAEQKLTSQVSRLHLSLSTTSTTTTAAAAAHLALQSSSSNQSLSTAQPPPLPGSSSGAVAAAPRALLCHTSSGGVFVSTSPTASSSSYLMPIPSTQQQQQQHYHHRTVKLSPLTCVSSTGLGEMMLNGGEGNFPMSSLKAAFLMGMDQSMASLSTMNILPTSCTSLDVHFPASPTTELLNCCSIDLLHRFDEDEGGNNDEGDSGGPMDAAATALLQEQCFGQQKMERCFSCPDVVTHHSVSAQQLATSTWNIHKPFVLWSKFPPPKVWLVESSKEEGAGAGGEFSQNNKPQTGSGGTTFSPCLSRRKEALLMSSGFKTPNRRRQINRKCALWLAGLEL